MITSFRDLEVYQESFKLQLEIEKELKEFPRDEKFLLCDQVRRATRAIPSLIAEGWGKRETIRNFRKFLRDAQAEAYEMVNHLLLAKHKGYINPRRADEYIERYEKLAKRIKNLKNNWQNFDQE
jgi:four helix bundle protein